MKVALCISGGLRNFEDTFYSFKEFLLDIFDVDVFFYGVENKKGAIQNEITLKELFNPKRYKVNTLSFYNTIPCNYTLSTSFYSFYNVYKCNELKKEFEKENNFLYDIVIRSRLDYFWFRSITENEIEIAQNFVLTPLEWSFKSVSTYAISDAFAFSTSKLIDKYANIFCSLDTYCEQLGGLHPETITGYHCNKHNIPVKEINRHVIFEYPCARVEKYILPYKFSKYFDVPKVNNENDFLSAVTSLRKKF